MTARSAIIGAVAALIVFLIAQFILASANVAYGTLIALLLAGATFYFVAFQARL